MPNTDDTGLRRKLLLAALALRPRGCAARGRYPSGALVGVLNGTILLRPAEFRQATRLFAREAARLFRSGK
jgi:hypothetical protein